MIWPLVFLGWITAGSVVENQLRGHRWLWWWREYRDRPLESCLLSVRRKPTESLRRWRSSERPGYADHERSAGSRRGFPLSLAKRVPRNSVLAVTGLLHPQGDQFCPVPFLPTDCHTHQNSRTADRSRPRGIQTRSPRSTKDPCKVRLSTRSSAAHSYCSNGGDRNGSEKSSREIDNLAEENPRSGLRSGVRWKTMARGS